MRKPTRSYVNCEVEVQEGGGAYRFSVWSDDGRPISAQQIMDAVSDCILMEFGSNLMSETNANIGPQPH